MTTVSCGRSEWEPFRLATALRGVAVVMGVALLLAGCGHGSAPPSSAPAKSSATVATAAPVSAPSSASSGASAPAALPGPAVATASSAQAQQTVGAAQSRLASMSVPALLAAARQAYAQHRLVSPAGDNAMEYYEAVLARDPGNGVAKDALRETFPFGVPEVEKAIAQNNFEEAGREIDLLSRADPTNYTLTLLRSRLDAQKKLQARQQQQAQLQQQQLQAQKQAALAAAKQAAAARDAEEKAAAARLAAQQRAASAKPVPEPKRAASPPPKAAGETHGAAVVAPAAPEYPIQAARNQTSGYAIVEFTISTDGSVENPHIVDSSPRRVFDTAAIQAVRRSKFKPALKDGQPVASTLRRRIDFKFGG